MPPVRTTDSKKSKLKNGSLLSMGFEPISRQERLRDQAQAKITPQAERVEVDPEMGLPKPVPATERIEECPSSETGSSFKDDTMEPNPSALTERAPPRADNPPIKKKTLLKPSNQEPGLKEVRFTHNDDWEDYAAVVGTKTRKLMFGSKDEGFDLEDTHIDQIIALGPGVCRSLWEFQFEFRFNRDGPISSAEKLSEDAVVRMAQNFPSLRRVTLQNTRNLTDRALMAFFEHCENLSFLEISTLKKDGSMDGTAFDFLRERPRLARKLKTLRVMDNKWFMKPLRELGKEREDLLIQLVRTSEVYDGEMELWGTDYRRGRKSGDSYGKQLDRWKNERLDPGVFHENWRSRKKWESYGNWGSNKGWGSNKKWGSHRKWMY